MLVTLVGDEKGTPRETRSANSQRRSQLREFLVNGVLTFALVYLRDIHVGLVEAFGAFGFKQNGHILKARGKNPPPRGFSTVLDVEFFRMRARYE